MHLVGNVNYVATQTVRWSVSVSFPIIPLGIMCWDAGWMEVDVQPLGQFSELQAKVLCLTDGMDVLRLGGAGSYLQ